MTRGISIEANTLEHQIIVGIVPRGRLGSGPGQFHYPSSVAILNNRAYVADSWNHRVQVFDLPEWKFAFEFGDFFCPKWIEPVEDRGRPLLLIVDTNNSRLCFHEPDGHRVHMFQCDGPAFPVTAHVADSKTIEIVFDDEHVETFDLEWMIHRQWWITRLQQPLSIVRDAGGFTYVSDLSRHTVEKFDSHGEFIAQILGPEALAQGGRLLLNGNDLIVTDYPASAVVIYDTVKATHRRWNHTFIGPGFINQHPNGEIWVGTYREQPDPAGAAFAVFTSDYRFLRNVVLREAHQPTFIAFVAGRILIADQEARNVLIFSEDGTFMEYLRPEPYPQPVWSIATGGEGHVYIGVGAVVDILWAADLNRLYYIDYENAAVRFSIELQCGAAGKGGTS